jgi:DNA-binding transcriptional LysR family regulator
VLSAVTAHVREKNSSFGVALEDADMTGLDRRAIATLLLVPVAASSHGLARRPGPLDQAGLADAVQIVLGEHRQPAERAPDALGVLSSRVWRVVDLATKHALIVNGLGWGHMPEHLVRDDLQAGRLVPLTLAAWGEQPLRRALVLVNRPDSLPGPVAHWAQARLAALCLGSVTPDPGATAGSPRHQGA